MSANNTPLEKQLFHLNLSRGIDQRVRPETGDPSVTLTRVENLVQNQNGGLVKRPGTPLLGGTATDDQGAALPPPTKLLRLVKGLGMVGNTSDLLHYQENLGKFRTVGRLPELVHESSDFIASSGTNVASRMTSGAASSGFYALAHGNPESVSPSPDVVAGKVVIYDINAGAAVAEYELTRITGDGDAFTQFDSDSMQLVFVQDRYLHIYILANNGTDAGIWGLVIDTAAALPEDGTLDATLLDNTGMTLSIVDAAVSGARSFVVVSDSTDTTVLCMSGGTQALADSASFAANLQLQAAANATHLWLLSASDLTALSVSSLSTVLVAPGAHGMTLSSNVTMACTTSNYVVVNLYTTETFGGSTVGTITTHHTTSAAGTACTLVCKLSGWKPSGNLFFDANTGKVFGACSKVSSFDVTGHAIVEFGGIPSVNILPAKLTNTNGGNSYTSRPVACSLEPHIAALNYKSLRPLSYDGIHHCLFLPIQTAARGTGYVVTKLKSCGHSAIASVNHGGSSVISGGAHVSYSGSIISETGFVDMPSVNANTTGGPGSPNGSYKYVAVHRYMDETGAVAYSRTSEVASVTVVSKIIPVLVTPCAVTLRDAKAAKTFGAGFTVDFRPTVTTEVYRTTAGGTQYYLVASNQAGTPGTGLSTQLLTVNANGFLSASDNLSDATLQSQPLLFRQPGTTNTPLDRYAPPLSNIICQHGDRLFTTDPYGVRVYYSSFFVDGEAPWYNPLFSFFVHGGTGPITALVSMDGRLLVFKRDGIFIVDGDGPPEGGVAGNEFSPPKRLATEYGCIDQRSVVVTTEGVVYRSGRGIELLTRSLQVKWLGERVFELVDANPVVTGSVLDASGRVHIGLAVSRSNSSVQTAIDGIELIYDFPSDCWTSSVFTDNSGTLGRCVQDMCLADLYGYGETVCYADASGAVVQESTATGLDRGSRYVTWALESGWIRTGQQTRQRISNILFLAKKVAGANHAIKMSLAYDYVDSYTQQNVWEPDVINGLAIEELCIKPSRQQVLAIRVKIEEQAPAVPISYPTGTGLGTAVLGVTGEIAPMNGAPFANRGTAGSLSNPPAVGGISPATGTTLGGTSVTIYGVNFTAGSTVTIGGVAATGVSYVSANQLTATTPAGSVGAKDVVVSTSGGSGTLSGAFTYAVVSFDPATLQASIWVKQTYAGAPWAFSASAGPSFWLGSFTSNTGDPTVASLNGYDVASYNGTQSLRALNAYSDTIYRPTAGGIIALFRPTAAAADTGSIYDNAAIIADSAGNTGLTYTSSGFRGFVSSSGYQSVLSAKPTGSWYLVMLRWDGSTLGLTVNSDSEVTTACGAVNLNGAYQLTGNGYASNFITGQVAEIMTLPVTPSLIDYAGFKSYVNTKYALSL